MNVGMLLVFHAGELSAGLRYTTTKTTARQYMSEYFVPYAMRPPAAANSGSGKTADSRRLAATAVTAVDSGEILPTSTSLPMAPPGRRVTCPVRLASSPHFHGTILALRTNHHA